MIGEEEGLPFCARSESAASSFPGRVDLLPQRYALSSFAGAAETAPGRGGNLVVVAAAVVRRDSLCSNDYPRSGDKGLVEKTDFVEEE